MLMLRPIHYVDGMGLHCALGSDCGYCPKCVATGGVMGILRYKFGPGFSMAGVAMRFTPKWC